MITNDINQPYLRSKRALVVRGILGIGIGIFILERPLESVAALALAIALWALIDGIITIVHALDLRGAAPHWGVQLIAGIVSVAFGIAALFRYPELSLDFAVIWVAIWLLSIGVLAVYAAILQSRAGASWGWTMLIVAPSIAAGILALAYPGVTLVSLMLLMAAYGVIGGIAMLLGAALLEPIPQDRHQALGGDAKAA